MRPVSPQALRTSHIVENVNENVMTGFSKSAAARTGIFRQII
jgi:hypothetical protein